MNDMTKDNIKEEETMFEEAFGEVLWALNQIINSKDDGTPLYEKVGWAIDDLSKMVRSFQQVANIAMNLSERKKL